MPEILLILLVLGVGLLLRWMAQWDPGLLLWVVTVTLVVLNFGMTFINWIQSIRRDARFLDAWILGLVQIGVGTGLLAVFLPTLGDRPETWLAGTPFIAGGAVVLIRRAFPPRGSGRSSNHGPRASGRSR